MKTKTEVIDSMLRILKRSTLALRIILGVQFLCSGHHFWLSLQTSNTTHSLLYTILAMMTWGFACLTMQSLAGFAADRRTWEAKKLDV